MNKKSQFYIITAVILLALTFGLSKPKIKYASDRNFKELCENYIKEAPFAANTGNLNEFTQKFVDYGKTKEPNFGLLYLEIRQDNITAFNLVKKTTYINEFKLSFNETLTTDRENQVIITLDKNQYIFNTSEYPKISVLIFSESENTTKVCIKNA
ncbi:MAG: hypothetical protein QXG86_03925 [Candidatus Woesearchaeota archaeon]